jgi:oligoendopeptidase F
MAFVLLQILMVERLLWELKILGGHRKMRWHLKELLNGKSFEENITDLEKQLRIFESYFGRLDNNISKEDYTKIIMHLEKMSANISRLSSFIGLSQAENTKSQEAMKYKSLFESFSIKYSDIVRKFCFWEKGLDCNGLNGLDEKNALRLSRIIPSRKDSFLYSRELAKHSLKEDQEKIIQRKDLNGINVVTELYDQITTNFKFEMKINGKKKKFNNSKEIMDLVFDKNLKIRKGAYLGYYKPYKENKEILFNIYSAIVKDWNIERDLRKYPSAISVMNTDNWLNDEVIKTLLSVCERNKKIYQDFFKLKAKELGLKKLTRFDVYAPLKKSDKKYSFEEAKKMVLENFKEFDEEFYLQANKLFKEEKIDAFPRENKRSGAFCYSVNPDLIPYVLLNYSGKEDDVYTMAHEFGHAIHAMQASHQLPSLFHSVIPLAETASTFSELILFNKLLNKANKKERRIMLMNKLEDSYKTIMRQAFFVKFELIAHEKIPMGITEEGISNLYLQNLKELFENSVDVDENFKYEYLVIPHIYHTPFYCYGYAFGELLTLALYAEYLKGNKLFVKKLKSILIAGGTKEPKVLLKEQGFDITKEEFWQEGFNLVQSWLNEVKCK